MAQHIEIINQHWTEEPIVEKRMREIEKSIKKSFAKGLNSVKGSLKFRAEDSEFYGFHKDDVVFSTDRALPYDKVVWKSDRGGFEIHFNQKTNIIEHIFLVA